jgi:hypothetical protein
MKHELKDLSCDNDEKRKELIMSKELSVNEASGCDKCHYHKTLIIPTNATINRCAHPKFDKPRRITNIMISPTWCPIKGILK